MLAGLRGLLRKWGSFPFLLSLTLIASDWRGEAFFFSFLLYYRDQLSHYRLMTFVGANPFCGEKTVCVLLSWSLYSLLTCLCQCQGPWGGAGREGGGAWCAVSDSDSLHPRGQTTGWGRAIPRRLVQQAPKQGMNAAMAFHNSYLICWHISGVSNSARGIFAHMDPCSSSPLEEGAEEQIF